MVNAQYIASASQEDAYRTEPPFKLQGSYRNMNKIAEKIVAVMNDDEVERLIDDHYQGESQTLTTAPSRTSSSSPSCAHHTRRMGRDQTRDGAASQHGRSRHARHGLAHDARARARVDSHGDRGKAPGSNRWHRHAPCAATATGAAYSHADSVRGLSHRPERLRLVHGPRERLPACSRRHTGYCLPAAYPAWRRVRETSDERVRDVPGLVEGGLCG
jgi:hypothetical protein